MRAWPCGLRRPAACSIPSSCTSSTKQPRPRRRRGSSLRGMRAPIIRVVMARGALRGRGRATRREQRARPADGPHDVHVTGAPAEVARQPDADLLVTRPRVLLEERADRHQDARRAEAALQPVLLVKRLLNRMQALGIGRQALDGGDLSPVDLDRHEQARPHRLAVEQDGAGAADAVLAAHVRPRQAQSRAQEIAEEEPRRHGFSALAPVHPHANGNGERAALRAQASPFLPQELEDPLVR